MKKKLFSILLCAALVFAMAVPAFADVNPRIGVYQTFLIGPQNSSIRITAMYGRVGQQVFLWGGGMNIEYQKWTTGRFNSELRLYANFTIGQGTQYVIADVGGYAGTYSEYGTTAATSSLEFVDLGSSIYRVKLIEGNKYLTVSSNPQNGDSIRFTNYSATDVGQKWKFTNV